MMKKTLSDVIPDYLTDGGIFTALNALDVPWKTAIGGDVLDIEYMGNISGSKRVSPLINKMLGDNTELTAGNITTLANVIYRLNITNWNKLYSTLTFEYDPISNYDMTETETASGTTSGTRLNTGTQTTTATGTETTAHTGTQSIDHTGTLETEHTGTQSTESETSASGNSSGTNTSNIFGFNSSSSVGDNEGGSTATSTNSATGSDTRTDDLTDTRTDNLTDERTDNLTDTRTDNLTNQRTDNLTETENGSNSSSRTLTRSGNIGVTTSQQMIQSERDLWLWNFFYNVVFSDVDKVTTISTY